MSWQALERTPRDYGATNLLSEERPLEQPIAELFVGWRKTDAVGLVCLGGPLSDLTKVVLAIAIKLEMTKNRETTCNRSWAGILTTYVVA